MPDQPGTAEEADAYLWLEEIEGQEALAWVEAQNGISLGELRDRQYERDRVTLAAILNAETQIPFFIQRGKAVYNFWTDAKHKRGISRRTTFRSYVSEEPDWETVLDIDALGRAEGESYVWRGFQTLPPDHRYALAQLSRGGADAVVVREFDLRQRAFVANGFVLPEAKTDVSWIDADTLLVATSLLGEVTTSGYARTVRRWRRGTPFSESQIVFEGRTDDMMVGASRDHELGANRTYYWQRRDFMNADMFVEPDGEERRKLDVPSDAWPSLKCGWMVMQLRSAWTPGERSYAAGSLIVIKYADFMAGSRDFQVLFEPMPRTSLQSWLSLGDHVAIAFLDNVRSRVDIGSATPQGWTVAPYGGLRDDAAHYIMRRHDEEDDQHDEFLVQSTGYLTPSALLRSRVGAAPQVLKRLPDYFDASGLEVTQHEAPAADGTAIPYFQVAPKGMRLDGTNAVRLSGYGGFMSPTLPYYSASIGKLWLERGHVWVSANIRGGGEFGPAWHEAALREKRPVSHDDFAAVAKHLIDRGVTRPSRLAIEGGSNGGLLVGNMLTRYPELFGAIVCEIPLLDMRRYTKLLAGQSWAIEYGDPDKPEDWAFLKTYSPYHLVSQEGAYPPVLFMTTRRDDRVHPGHARKMAAKMQVMGHNVLFFENPEGGHGVGADHDQMAFTVALKTAFIRKALKLG